MSGESDTNVSDQSVAKPVSSGGSSSYEIHDDLLLQDIEEMFAAGLETQVEPFPETNVEFAAILDELRALPPEQLREKLVISGWKLEPHGPDQMRCQECMYYLVNRGWCDLPELDLPAKPDWYCKLWRI